MIAPHPGIPCARGPRIPANQPKGACGTLRIKKTALEPIHELL